MFQKPLIAIIALYFVVLHVNAQDNLLLSRDYWKTNPSVLQVKKAISDGNNPKQLNKYAFDAVVYALLEKTNDNTIKYLLSLEGNDVEKRTHDSRTYIFWAAYKGNTAIMQHLFDKGALLNVKDSHGYTPVTFAAVTGQKDHEVYEIFEKNGATLTEEKNSSGANALLLIAPFLKTNDELNYFISKGFSLKDKDLKGNTIFNYTAKRGNIPFLKMLISKGVNPDVTNKEGGNAMLYASQGMRRWENTLDTYKFLEGLGIKVNVIGDESCNPLHKIAYQNENIDILSYFIDHNVDVNLQDQAGVSPFMNAALGNNLKAVTFLSTYVNDINTKNNNGCSALALAVAENSAEVVEYILKKGGDIHTRDIKNNSLAYYLLNGFNPKDTAVFDAKLKLLDNQGLSMSQLQNEGNSLLHIAAKKNDLDLLKRLKPYKIDVNAKNNEGYTALHIAAMKAKNSDILKYLIEQGANKGIKTEFEETALTLANENEQLQAQNAPLNFLR